MGRIRIGECFFKGIEIHNKQVDGLDAVLAHLLLVAWVIEYAEESAVDFGLERFHASVHYFRKTGIVAHTLDGNSIVTQKGSRAAGGENFDAESMELVGKFNNARFVGNTYQCAGYRVGVWSHDCRIEI